MLNLITLSPGADIRSVCTEAGMYAHEGRPLQRRTSLMRWIKSSRGTKSSVQLLSTWFTTEFVLFPSLPLIQTIWARSTFSRWNTIAYGSSMSRLIDSSMWTGVYEYDSVETWIIHVTDVFSEMFFFNWFKSLQLSASALNRNIINSLCRMYSMRRILSFWYEKPY